MTDADKLQYLAVQFGAMVTNIFTPQGKPVYRAEFSDPFELECFLLNVIDAGMADRVLAGGLMILIYDL
jgi:hypothetical protein